MRSFSWFLVVPGGSWWFLVVPGGSWFILPLPSSSLFLLVLILLCDGLELFVGILPCL